MCERAWHHVLVSDTTNLTANMTDSFSRDKQKHQGLLGFVHKHDRKQRMLSHPTLSGSAEREGCVEAVHGLAQISPDSTLLVMLAMLVMLVTHSNIANCCIGQLMPQRDSPLEFKSDRLTGAHQ